MFSASASKWFSASFKNDTLKHSEKCSKQPQCWTKAFYWSHFADTVPQFRGEFAHDWCRCRAQFSHRSTERLFSLYHEPRFSPMIRLTHFALTSHKFNRHNSALLIGTFKNPELGMTGKPPQRTHFWLVSVTIWDTLRRFVHRNYSTSTYLPTTTTRDVLQPFAWRNTI